ncbi:MAG: site-specific integrase, partial [Clostridiales bacterium]|nr:site-specific integrase [Clostridiales bacterium]
NWVSKSRVLCGVEIPRVYGYFTGGMKTKAGKNRRVPIHSKIMPLVQARYKEAQTLKSDYLFNKVENCQKKRLTYSRFSGALDRIKALLELNPNHRPHDGRKEFVTLAKRYGVDEYAIKYIVGHVINDLTENVYTVRDDDWLKTEIEKIR